MPHLFTNRPRLHDLTRDSADLQAQFRWETINAVLYKIGGLVFIADSVLFFPRFEQYADIVAWTFFVGSLLYLVVTGHDMAEAVRYRKRVGFNREVRLEYIAALGYLAGTILFTVGSIFFLSTVGWFIAAARCFIIGRATGSVDARMHGDRSETNCHNSEICDCAGIYLNGA